MTSAYFVVVDPADGTILRTGQCMAGRHGGRALRRRRDAGGVDVQGRHAADPRLLLWPKHECGESAVTISLRNSDDENYSSGGGGSDFT